MKLFKQVFLLVIIGSLFIPSVADAKGTVLGGDGLKSSVVGYGTSDDYEKQQSSQLNSILDLNLNYSTNSLQYIKKCSSYIKDMGDGIVYIKACTDSLITVDSIKVKVYLEKWNGSSWSTVSNWTKSESDSDNVTFQCGAYVEQNKKYRVKTLHTVTHNGTSESEVTITTYIIPE